MSSIIKIREFFPTSDQIRFFVYQFFEFYLRGKTISRLFYDICLVSGRERFFLFSFRSWEADFLSSGRLREVPFIVIWLGNFWYCEKLFADGCLREVVEKGGWTVYLFLLSQV